MLYNCKLFVLRIVTWDYNCFLRIIIIIIIINYQLNYHDQKIWQTLTWHRETLDCCFDLIRSHQQCIPWSPPLEIKPVTIDCRAKTLQLSQLFTLHTSDAKYKKKKKIGRKIYIINYLKQYNCVRTNDYYWIKIISWKHIIIDIR